MSNQGRTKIKMNPKRLSLLAIVAISLCLSSCRKSPPAPAATASFISSSEVSSNLMETFSAIGNTADDSYVLPSHDWINHEFRGAWLEFKTSLGEWQDNENDCDDFARGAAFFAQLLHHNTPLHRARTALAFGEFWYRPRTGGGHAVNFYLYRDLKGAIQIGFFEPQNGNEVALTATEIGSCTAWRL